MSDLAWLALRLLQSRRLVGLVFKRPKAPGRSECGIPQLPVRTLVATKRKRRKNRKMKRRTQDGSIAPSVVFLSSTVKVFGNRCMKHINKNAHTKSRGICLMSPPHFFRLSSFSCSLHTSPYASFEEARPDLSANARRPRSQRDLRTARHTHTIGERKKKNANA